MCALRERVKECGALSGDAQGKGNVAEGVHYSQGLRVYGVPLIGQWRTEMDAERGIGWVRRLCTVQCALTSRVEGDGCTLSRMGGGYFCTGGKSWGHGAGTEAQR